MAVGLLYSRSIAVQVMGGAYVVWLGMRWWWRGVAGKVELVHEGKTWGQLKRSSVFGNMLGWWYSGGHILVQCRGGVICRIWMTRKNRHAMVNETQ
jgi:hypothetical protein